jgi:hypothetical protein
MRGFLEKVKALMVATLATLFPVGMTEQMQAAGVFTAVCRDKDGNIKWTDTFHNVVTTVGANDMLDKYFAGSAYTGAFYLGVISAVSYTGVPVIGDTMSSHPTWTEAGATNAPTYSQGSRPSAVWSAAAAKSKALSGVGCTFNITSAGTLKGAFLSTVATKDGTTGILFSAGLFQGGDKVVANTDVITVSYSLGV